MTMLITVISGADRDVDAAAARRIAGVEAIAAIANGAKVASVAGQLDGLAKARLRDDVRDQQHREQQPARTP